MPVLFVSRPRAALASDRRLRSAALTCGIVLVALPWLWATPDSARPVPVPDDEQLRRALLEARDNCLVAALAARGYRIKSPLFRTVELRRALRSDLLQDAEMGELAAIEHEATWLASVGATEDLGARSWEDVRFLTGALHWDLEASANALDARARKAKTGAAGRVAAGLAPGSGAGEKPKLVPEDARARRWARHRVSVEELDDEALREFRGMSFEDLLGVWD